MKKSLLIALVLGLAFTGCGGAAAQSTTILDAPPAEIEVDDTAVPPPSDGLPHSLDILPPDQDEGLRRDNENTVVGRITAISDSEMTVALAEMTRPERGEGGDGNPPQRDGGAAAEPPSGADGRSTPERTGDGEQPGGGRSPGGGGQRGGVGGELTDTGETATYPLAGSVEIRSGVEGDTSGALADLALGDVVRLTLDDDGNVIAISAMALPSGDGPASDGAAESTEEFQGEA